MKNIRLGDVLIEFFSLTPDQLNTALAYQKEHRDLRVGQALQELGYVNERQVLEALAQRLQLTMIDIEHTNVDVTAVEKVPQELAQKYDMLPIAQSPRALTIAAMRTDDPDDLILLFLGKAAACKGQRQCRILEESSRSPELLTNLIQK